MGRKKKVRVQRGGVADRTRRWSWWKIGLLVICAELAAVWFGDLYPLAGPQQAPVAFSAAGALLLQWVVFGRGSDRLAAMASGWKFLLALLTLPFFFTALMGGITLLNARADGGVPLDYEGTVEARRICWLWTPLGPSRRLCLDLREVASPLAGSESVAVPSRLREFCVPLQEHSVPRKGAKIELEVGRGALGLPWIAGWVESTGGG